MRCEWGDRVDSVHINGSTVNVLQPLNLEMASMIWGLAFGLEAPQGRQGALEEEEAHARLGLVLDEAPAEDLPAGVRVGLGVRQRLVVVDARVAVEVHLLGDQRAEIELFMAGRRAIGIALRVVGEAACELIEVTGPAQGDPGRRGRT